MADQPDFAKLVPGFDFLQKLVGSANAAMPAMGQWVAPTLNPEELEKLINELRTVQFWLEQNARMLGATIQALEVQRMTLTTLKTMNVKMGDLRDALKIRLPDPPAAPAPAPAPAAKPPAAAAAPGAAGAPGDKPAAGAVDPMQWWSALTQQFGQLAAQAMQDGAAAAEAARATLTSSMAQATAAAKKAPEGQGAEPPADTPETPEAPAAKAARKRSTK